MAVVAQFQRMQRALSAHWPTVEQRIREMAKRRVDKDLGRLESQIAEIERLPKDQLLDRIGDLNRLYRDHKMKLDDGVTVLVLGFGFTLVTSMLAGAISVAWSRARGTPITEESLRGHFEHALRSGREEAMSERFVSTTQASALQSGLARQYEDVVNQLRKLEHQQRWEQHKINERIDSMRHEQRILFAATCFGALAAAAPVCINMFKAVNSMNRG
eukprot:TRINITY_DN31180_c0_g1_i1.p1 TRINITY_DN31180_c0_g1~~TRINITY_DN31180_c0_g1_i1.p1  ORF type:complete len:216 (-),score=27.10 TRINITY_DN31180_c0_g1_i1:167-814(-)